MDAWMPLPLHDERGPPPPGGSEAVWSQLWRSRARWRDVKRSLLVAVHGSPVFRAAASVRDELRAHLTWGFGRVLAPTSRVPLPAEWDSRHAVALLELARTLSDTARAAGVDGHADAWLALPPVTAALCFAQLLVFFRPGGVRLADVSLSPYCVVERRELSRLVTAALVHVDAPHLIANLSAALPDCVALEVAYGSTPLAADLLLLTLGAHGLYVAAAWAQARLFVRRSQYYSLVVVGFSGAAFALKVWAGCRRGGSVRLWGLAVPARYSWCVSLALTHLCVPEASLPAHLAGVAAGLLRAYVVQPVLVALHGMWTAWQQPRISTCHHGAAQAGGVVMPCDPAAQETGRHPPLAAAAAAACVTPGSSWVLPPTRPPIEPSPSWPPHVQDCLTPSERWAAAASPPGGSPRAPSSSCCWRCGSECGELDVVGGPSSDIARVPDQLLGGVGDVAHSQGSVVEAACASPSLPHQPRSLRGQLLEAGVQLLLLGSAVVLYAAMSRGERGSTRTRLSSTLWRR